jgi:hypothetical protein
LRSEHLEQILPELVRDGYAVTSPRSDSYNCYAWAAGDDTRVWFPDRHHQHYWPIRLRNRRIETYAQAFATIGYTSCGMDCSLEVGYEKVAVYAVGFLVEHMARQLPDGTWTSKCGEDQDIVQNTLSSLEGDEYSFVRMILKRPVP